MNIHTLSDVILLIAFVAAKAFGWCLITFSSVVALMSGISGEGIFQAAIGLVLLGVGEFAMLRLMANGID